MSSCLASLVVVVVVGNHNTGTEFPAFGPGLTSINKIEQQFAIIAIVPGVVAPRPADDGCREGGGARVCRELLPPGAVEDEAGEVDHEERRLEVRREERLVVLKGKNMMGRKDLFSNFFSNPIVA